MRKVGKRSAAIVEPGAILRGINGASITIQEPDARLRYALFDEETDGMIS